MRVSKQTARPDESVRTGFACVRESETLSISFEIFNFKRCEECTDPVRIDKCTHVLYTRIKLNSRGLAL